MENITRYNIMRQVTASQAQLVAVSRSLAVSYSNILIDAKKRTIFRTLLEEKQVNQMHLLSWLLCNEEGWICAAKCYTDWHRGLSIPEVLHILMPAPAYPSWNEKLFQGQIKLKTVVPQVGSTVSEVSHKLSRSWLFHRKIYLFIFKNYVLSG